VNPGGEPERDDTGLPPVDIEIPDDARELDRDVQAYYREQRARRRQQRGLRLRGSLTRDGIVLPLLACCLILALITGTLLTVFTATSDPNSLTSPGSASTAPPSGAGSAAASSAGALVPPDVVPGPRPQGTIAIAGQATPVQTMHRAALILIPAHCNCTAAVSWLIGQVTIANARAYLVYTDSTKATVEGLYASLAPRPHAEAVMAVDTDSVLSASVPRSLPPGGPTAILLGPTRVAYATGFSETDDPTKLLETLTH
jgi:hypothetical protein